MADEEVIIAGVIIDAMSMNTPPPAATSEWYANFHYRAQGRTNRRGPGRRAVARPIAPMRRGGRGQRRERPAARPTAPMRRGGRGQRGERPAARPTAPMRRGGRGQRGERPAARPSVVVRPPLVPLLPADVFTFDDSILQYSNPAHASRRYYRGPPLPAILPQMQLRVYRSRQSSNQQTYRHQQPGSIRQWYNGQLKYQTVRPHLQRQPGNSQAGYQPLQTQQYPPTQPQAAYGSQQQQQQSAPFNAHQPQPTAQPAGYNIPSTSQQQNQTYPQYQAQQAQPPHVHPRPLNLHQQYRGIYHPRYQQDDFQQPQPALVDLSSSEDEPSGYNQLAPATTSSH
jgi:hypothetical protein